MARNTFCRSLPVLFVGVVAFAACHHEPVPAEPVADRATPRWVLLPPDDDTYFHGVGSAPMGIDPAWDQKAALDNARLALLADIRTRFASFLGAWHALSDDVDAVVWDTFAGELDGIVPVDTYYDSRRRQYWCYLRLPTQDLHTLIERRGDSLAPRARKHMREAEARRRHGELPRAIQEAAAAYAYCAGPEGLFMEGDHPGIALRDEVVDLLTGLLEDVAIAKVEGPTRCRGSGLRDTRLLVRVVQPSRQRPLEGVPVAFRFTRGSGQVDPVAITDDDGLATAQLQALNPRVSPVEIVASLDMNAMLKKARVAPLPASAWDRLAIPNVPFVITLIPPRILLANIERGGTGGGRGAIIVGELADALRAQGIEVQQADVEYLVNPVVFEKVEKGEDPGPVPDVDLIGVVAISLDRIRKEKGQYQDVLYGEGTAVFRLFDLERHVLVMDVHMDREVSGFSAGDVERNFFLQSMDELRTRVIDELTEHPFFGER